MTGRLLLPVHPPPGRFKRAPWGHAPARGGRPLSNVRTRRPRRLPSGRERCTMPIWSPSISSSLKRTPTALSRQAHAGSPRVISNRARQRRARHASAMRGAPSRVMRRRSDSRGTVWRLSKLTTQSVGTPSRSRESFSSETSPRSVRVSAATTTAPIRAATGSRVSTSTGRSPPGVAANHTSPRLMLGGGGRVGPVGPLLGRPPVGDCGQR